VLLKYPDFVTTASVAESKTVYYSGW